MVLRMSGHEVRTLYAAREALDLALAWRPQAMLLDIGLPDLDGYALAQQLRREPLLQSTWLVAITGYGQPADRERSRAAGFNDHLVKPVDVDRVLEALQRAVS
jgi:two-component system, sensor histidine kinase